MSKVVKKWVWRDKRGRPHNCVELEDGSRFVFEKKNGKIVPRPIGLEETEK